MQFVVEVKSKRVLSVAVGKGRVHDLKLLKNSQMRCAQEVKIGGDKGYQGIQKWHSNSQTPHKKPRGRALSKVQKQENRLLASERIVVEHVNRRFKRPCP
jgi:IS5 family transposase